MLSQLEEACKTYSTESSSGLIEFDSNWQRIFVTALTFHLNQAITVSVSVPGRPTNLDNCRARAYCTYSGFCGRLYRWLGAYRTNAVYCGHIFVRFNDLEDVFT